MMEMSNWLSWALEATDPAYYGLEVPNGVWCVMKTVAPLFKNI